MQEWRLLAYTAALKRLATLPAALELAGICNGPKALAVQHSNGETLPFADWHARCCGRLSSAQSAGNYNDADDEDDEDNEEEFLDDLDDLDEEVSCVEAVIRTWLMEGATLNAARMFK